MVDVNFGKIFDLENRVGFTLPMQDFSAGVLDLNGKKYDVIAVICDCLLSSDKIESLNRQKSVIKVGEGHIRYAPELVKSVVYIKA